MGPRRPAGSGLAPPLGRGRGVEDLAHDGDRRVEGQGDRPGDDRRAGVFAGVRAWEAGQSEHTSRSATFGRSRRAAFVAVWRDSNSLGRMVKMRPARVQTW